MALYFAQKILRKDFIYWVPGLTGAPRVLLSGMSRVLVKIVVDYTGVVHFRHSFELGGAYWTASVLLALGVSFAIVRWYFSVVPAEEQVMEEDAAWRIVTALSASWVAAFAAFLYVIDERFRHTFYSTQRGYELTCAHFLEGEDDEAKMRVFQHNEAQYTSIYEELRAFVLENWEAWEDEDPVWFTDILKGRIPDDMIPGAALREMKMGGARRRRSSVGDLLSGGGEGGAGGAGGAGGREEGLARVHPVLVEVEDGGGGVH
jgi:hypothetical protein